MKTKYIYTAFVAVLCMASVYAYLRHNWGYAVDDSYITFRYAENARLGLGFVFNVGERFYGSTATGYAVILAWIAEIGDFFGAHWQIPDISTCLSGLGILVTALTCLMAMHRASIRLRYGAYVLPIAFTVVILFVLPLSNLVAGHETYFYVSLVLLATYIAIFHGRMFLATLVLIVATTCRPDVTLLALLLYVVVAARQLSASFDLKAVSRKLLPPGIFYLLGILAWCGWTKIYYGSFLPETLHAKEAQSKLGVFPIFNVANVESYLTTQFGGDYWTIIAIIALSVLVIASLTFSQPSRADSATSASDHTDLAAFSVAALLYAIALVVSYMLLDVSIWWWYVSPIGLFLLVAGLCGAMYILAPGYATLGLGNKGWFFKGWVAALVVVALFEMYATLLYQGKEFFLSRNVNPHLASYNFFEGYLRSENPGGATVATSEPGAMAYRLGPKFRVLDVLGLVTPGVVEAILDGNDNYVVPHLKPKYVIVSWQGKYQPDGYDGFHDHYQLVAEFDAPYWLAALHHGAYLYERIGDESAFQRANKLSVGQNEATFLQVDSLPSAKYESGTLCNLSSLNNINLLSGIPARVSQDAKDQIKGWVASEEHLPVGAIFVILKSSNGRTYSARVRHRFDDYGTGNYMNWTDGHFPSGFSGSFDFSGVAPGGYEVTLLFASHGKWVECSNGRAVDVVPVVRPGL